MHLGVRTDAAPVMGMGHLMRCLTLADALRGLGAHCTFLTRSGPAVLELIVDRGHGVCPLTAAAAPYGDHPTPPAHAPWLTTAWRDDARETADGVADLALDALIVDHYALDAHWERQVQRSPVPLIAIDDLADRPHDAHMLVDHNLGRIPGDYRALVSSTCRVLLGPAYALIRPAFTESREEARRRRQSATRRRLLVSLGGGQNDDILERLLAMLNEVPGSQELDVTLLGGFRGAAPKPQAAPGNYCFSCEHVAFADDVVQLIMETDFCIGAAGVSALERAALLQPGMLLALADNQAPIAANFHDRGFALALPSFGSATFTAQFKQYLEHLRSVAGYRAMVHALDSEWSFGDSRVVAAQVLESLP